MQPLARASWLLSAACWFKGPKNCLKNNNNNNNLKKSNHRCCAERNLLNSWVARAHKQNVPRHQVVRWVRRKAGAQLTVWRQLADGSLGVSVPCVVCRNALQLFDIRVTCMVAPGQWFSGYVTDEDAPAAKLTSAQERMLKGRK
eukprot:GHUV01005322.1.p1 GENE.GHUV01005322.1~~GHUV01005322.1.p1  ORF type:complete len:144 (+),score=33.03 GHUV01005322.1:159-590(+)